MRAKILDKYLLLYIKYAYCEYLLHTKSDVKLCNMISNTVNGEGDEPLVEKWIWEIIKLNTAIGNYRKSRPTFQLKISIILLAKASSSRFTQDPTRALTGSEWKYRLDFS